MRLRRSILAAAALGLALPALSAASAQEAARQEAQRLQSLFEAYLGAPAPGEEPKVTVGAEPGFYRVSVFLDRIAKPFEPFGLKVEPAVIALSITPQADGTWRTFDVSYPNLTYQARDTRGRVTFSGVEEEGVFDPALGVARSSRLTIGTVISESEDSAARARGESWDYRMESQARPTGPDTVTLQGTGGRRDLSQLTSLTWPPTGTGGTLIQIAASAATERSEVTITNLKPKRLLDLWAFLVAHPSRERLAAATGELRAVAGAALPLFDRMGGTSTLEGIAVQTPVGSVSASRAIVGVDMTGAVKPGGGGFLFQANDLMVTSDLIPAWARELVPGMLDIGLRTAGFDFEAASKLFIERFDPAVDPPIAPAVGREIAAALLPDGRFTVTVPPSRIRAALYDLRYEGEVAIADNKASGRFTIAATGLDRTIAALQAAKGAAGTGQALVGLYAAQAMAKVESDGTHVWVVELVPDGAPLVNGNPVGGRKP